jgi:hypothetical protein
MKRRSICLTIKPFKVRMEKIKFHNPFSKMKMEKINIKNK